MQNEQRLLQPSWTFKFGRVRSDEAANTGAAISSVWAKISATRNLGVAEAWGGGSDTSLYNGINPKPGARWVLVSKPSARCELSHPGSVQVLAANSLIRCLWELPTTHCTPGREPISSGALWA